MRIILYQYLQIKWVFNGTYGGDGCACGSISRSRAFKTHQNRHKLDLQVEEKGIDGPVTRVDRYLEQLAIDTLRKSYKNTASFGEEFGFSRR